MASDWWWWSDAFGGEGLVSRALEVSPQEIVLAVERQADSAHLFEIAHKVLPRDLGCAAVAGVLQIDFETQREETAFDSGRQRPRRSSLFRGNGICYLVAHFSHRP